MGQSYGIKQSRHLLTQGKTCGNHMVPLDNKGLSAQLLYININYKLLNVTTNGFLLFAIVLVTNWLLIDVKCILRTSLCAICTVVYSRDLPFEVLQIKFIFVSAFRYHFDSSI